MSKKMMVYIAVAILVAAGLGAAFLPGVLSNGQQGDINAVQVYITSWDTNGTTPVDVVFKISIDLNGDGSYDFPKESAVFGNTTIESAPFKLGGPLPAGSMHFSFEVEAFRIVDNIWLPMHYTANQTTPQVWGDNQVGAGQTWSYDATNAYPEDLNFCRISFLYFVA